MPLTSSTQHSSIYGWNGTNWDKMKIDSSGKLQVDMSQTSITTDISGQYINISNLPSDPSTATLQTAGNTTLTSIDGKITTCNTGAVVVASGAITETNSTAILADTASLDAKLPDQGQEAMSGSLPVVVASDQSDLPVKVNDLERKGSENNVENNATLNSQSVSSSSADITKMRSCFVVYNDTNTGNFDSVAVEVSGDSGSTYHQINELFPNDNYNSTKREASVSLEIGGFTHLRIRNLSSTTNYSNVNCSVYGVS